MGKKVSSYIYYNSSIYPDYTATISYLYEVNNAIIPNMQNHPHVIILNQKINANTKSPILLSRLVPQHKFICNANATIIDLESQNNRKKDGALINIYENVSVLLMMHALLNQDALFIYFKLFMR